MDTTIHHVIGEFDGVKQHCILCGEAIIDYTNAMFPTDSPPPKGWAAGDFYMTGKSPIVMATIPPNGTQIIECTNKQLPNDIDLDKLAQLLKYSDRYEISVQFWPYQTAVFIMKDGVDLVDYGGDFDHAIDSSIAYLKRINKNGK